jgi:hypothetical protein
VILPWKDDYPIAPQGSGGRTADDQDRSRAPLAERREMSFRLNVSDGCLSITGIDRMNQSPRYITSPTAELIHDALAMSRALLDSNVPEARFRATLLYHQAALIGDSDLMQSLNTIRQILVNPGDDASEACGVALLAVSDCLSMRLEAQRLAHPDSLPDPDDRQPSGPGGALSGRLA